MAAESEISLKVTATTDTAALTQTAAELKKVGDAAIGAAPAAAAANAATLDAAIKKLETTAPEAATAIKKLRTAVDGVLACSTASNLPAGAGASGGHESWWLISNTTNGITYPTGVHWIGGNVVFFS